MIDMCHATQRQDRQTAEQDQTSHVAIGDHVRDTPQRDAPQEGMARDRGDTSDRVWIVE